MPASSYRSLVLAPLLVCALGCPGTPAASPSPADAPAAPPTPAADAPPSTPTRELGHRPHAQPDADTDPRTVHGELRTEGGQRVLRVWGTPSEMGYAHGLLLRDAIIEIIDGYALDLVPPASLTAAASLYTTVAKIPPRLRTEAEGIIDGMEAAGGRHVPRLDRDLEVADILVLNAITDLVAIGCSSVSAWDASTRDDPSLGGAPIMVRNLDWSDDDDLLRNQLLIVYQPDEPTRQPVVSVAFAGYIGCLSCMNEAGVSALFNMGYGEGAASRTEALRGFAPANLLLRDALERRDIDGDGASRIADVQAQWADSTHAGSYIVHLLQPRDDGAMPATILEVEADGAVARSAQPEELGATVLAATNHHREKSAPQRCSRYAEIERTIETGSGRVDREQLWALGRRIRLGEIVHTVLVEPESRTLGVWLRGPDERARATTAPVTHTWAQLMGEKTQHTKKIGAAPTESSAAGE